MDTKTLLFFEGHAAALPLYEALESALFAAFPDMEKRVQKTQITFRRRCVFACVSFTRVRPKAEMPEGCLVLTLCLPAPIDSPRAAVRVEPYPGRWTNHLILRRAEDLDAELFRWIQAAYAFAARKGGRRGQDPE